MLSRARDFVEMKLWDEQRLEFLRRFLPFERGIPAHDTLNDVIKALDEELFTRCFIDWHGNAKCHREAIVAKGGNHLPALKANRLTTRENVARS